MTLALSLADAIMKTLNKKVFLFFNIAFYEGEFIKASKEKEILELPSKSGLHLISVETEKV